MSLGSGTYDHRESLCSRLHGLLSLRVLVPRCPWSSKGVFAIIAAACSLWVSSEYVAAGTFSGWAHSLGFEDVGMPVIQ